MKRAHYIIEGRVQGVCFRIYTEQEAQRLNITGWVCNRPDGTVEITAEGSDEQIDVFFAWCQHGPSYAEVTSVKESYSDATGEFDSFQIKP